MSANISNLNHETLKNVTVYLSMGDKSVVTHADIFYRRDDGSPIKRPSSKDDKEAVIIRWGSGSEGFTWYNADAVPLLITLGEYLEKSALQNETFFNFKNLAETSDTIKRVKWCTVNVGDVEYRPAPTLFD